MLLLEHLNLKKLSIAMVLYQGCWKQEKNRPLKRKNSKMFWAMEMSLRCAFAMTGMGWLPLFKDGVYFTRCPIARHHTIKDIEDNNWSHDKNVWCRAAHHTVAVLHFGGEKIFSRQPCFWSHDFNFLHKPIVYGVVHLLYGVALSDSVLQERQMS